MSGKHTRHRPRKPPVLKVSQEELTAIVAKAETALSAEESGKLKAAVALIGFLRTEIDAKTLSVERFQRMIFGAATEKTETVLGEAQEGPAADSPGKAAREKRPRGAGHGRNAASVYTGARRVKITHPTLSGADICPGCCQGKVYPCAEAAQAVRIEAMAPLSATVYERERLRCNLCGEVYTAPAPAQVGKEKYDETVPAMIGMLKYGAGLPFNRIERLQSGMGVPLPAATQWDLVKAGAEQYVPVHEELIRQGAQDALVHNDDTTMKILHLTREQRAAALGNDAEESRTGVFTSGIVTVGAGRKIVLFFTGVRHAGENLDQVLKRRSSELPPPIHMCDGLAANESKEFETLLARCLAHSRRRYVEIAESFPEEVRFVLETLREVYRIDADARKDGLDEEQRLKLHQKHSKPLMDRLGEWMQEQFAERRVEPNSTLGEAIQYMKRWPNLARYAKVDCGHIHIDQNAIERCFRPTKIGLRNYLFIGHPSAGWRSAVIYSVVGTCRLIGVNPEAYIRWVLPKLAAATNKTVDDILPHDFARLYGQSVTGR